ncbi:hypothetical protein Tco_1507502 [Tanacetum coccineum]
MAALRYRDEHNKVGYLQKPTGSDDYHQILDFLRASHIRSPELGPPAILATIDETPYTITDADWINIMAKVEANASLSKTLLGDDVTEDNFPAKVVRVLSFGIINIFGRLEVGGCILFPVFILSATVSGERVEMVTITMDIALIGKLPKDFYPEQTHTSGILRARERSPLSPLQLAVEEVISE